jgi:hypothetical protein
MADALETPPCSCCGKTHTEVKRLVVMHAVLASGKLPAAAICNECLSLIMQVIAAEDGAWRQEQITILQGIEPQNSN